MQRVTLTLLSLLAFAACRVPFTSDPTTETFVRAGIAGENAPAWVRGQIASQPGHVAFVGRGGGFNVLDERAAYDEAMGHARTQLSHFVSTKVIAEAALRDSSLGARFLQCCNHEAGSGERVDQSAKACVHEITNAVVGGVAPVDQYWEQWDVRTQTHPDGITRYKCWLLAQVDEATIGQYVQAALLAMVNREAVEAAELALKKQELETQNAMELVQYQEAQIQARDTDMEHARAVLASTNWELQNLRERIYYGRRFRLVEKEDCLHYPAPCYFPLVHPYWRDADILIRTDLLPVEIDRYHPVEVPVERPLERCLPCSKGN